MGNDETRARSAPVAGVLFDLGGTLMSYGSRDRMGQATAAALRRLGLDPDAPDVRAARQEASEAVQREYSARRSFLHRDLFRDRVARTASLLGVDAPAEVLDRFGEENTRNIVDHMPPQPDASATLRALADRRIYRAVVSNADDDWLGPSLRRHGLDALLDDWTSSEEADSCKPDAAIFAYALAKADLDPSAVLFVGDSLPHDVAGAHAAGIRSVHLTQPGAVTPLTTGLDAGVTPDFTIERLSEIVEIVDDLDGHVTDRTPTMTGDERGAGAP